MKELIKNTRIYHFYRTARMWFDRRSIFSSVDHEVTIDGVTTKFSTGDVYSYSWFYPRYANQKLHEEVATRKFFQEATTANVIVDVGTNLGWFTCIAARANPTAKVVGFELDLANYQLCKKNIAVNNLDNVVLQRAAVSNEAGLIEYRTNASLAASAMHRLGNSEGAQQEVQAIALDDYFSEKEYPSLMKIDVEGAEQLVLEGMNEILHSGNLNTIFIEIHPDWLRELGGSVKEIIQILDQANMSIFGLHHRSNQSIEEPIELAEIESIGGGGKMLVARRRAETADNEAQG